MPRMIDANALKTVLCASKCGLTDPARCECGCMDVMCIDDAPTIDAVKVVRCEDCQYWQPPTYTEQEDGSTVGHCTAALNGQQTDAYWFCADGTR